MATGNHFRYVFTNDLYDSRENTFVDIFEPVYLDSSSRRRLNVKKEYLPIAFASTQADNGR
jgi:hypothetical protein